MTCTANDWPVGRQPFKWYMTSSELALFDYIYRSEGALEPHDVRNVVSLWLERRVAPPDRKLRVDHMLSRRSLQRSGERLRASDDGRILARRSWKVSSACWIRAQGCSTSR